MKNPSSGERGATLVLNLMAMAAFALMAVAVYASSSALARGTANDMRQQQALATAEAGLEDALQSLYRNAEWRTGYSTKTFGTGYYNVSLSTDTPPRVTVTGYSASVPFYGRAARTISVQTAFTTGVCPYALFGDDIQIDGKLDAYDWTSSLQPCSTCFINGADVWANSSLKIGGTQTCPPTRLRGVGNIGGSHTLSTTGSGSAACVEEGVVTSTTTKALPNYSGAGAANFTVNAGSTVTLTAGTYNYKKVTINGVLNVNTSTGTVYINFDGNFNGNAGCQINNSSKYPSRLHITDVSGNSGHTIDLACSKPLHAYLEGNVNKFTIEQEVYGHYCGGSVQVSSSAGAIGLVHWDQGGGEVSKVGLRNDTNGWDQSYRR
jgi:hypothetical protein